MKEVELKVRIDDPKKIEKKIDEIASFFHEVQNKDTYWDKDSHEIRVREQENLTHKTVCIFITQKKRERRKGIEINDEIEFTLPKKSLSAFQIMLQNMGFTQKIKKVKHTKVFQLKKERPFAKELSIELSEVPSLGWFLELEILLDSEEGEKQESLISVAEKELYALLQKLEIEVGAIEPRPYAALLQDSPSV